MRAKSKQRKVRIGLLFTLLCWNLPLTAREVQLPAEPLWDLFFFGSSVALDHQPLHADEQGSDHFPTQGLDTRMRRVFHGSDCQASTTPAEERDRTASDVTVAALVLTPAAGAWFSPRDERLGLFSTALHAFALNDFLTTGIKVTALRQRPKRYYRPDQATDRRRDSLASFPSGHTSNAFAAATITRLLFPGRSAAQLAGLYGAATFVGLMRMAADKHFFTDVAAGALLGTGAAYLSYYAWERPQGWSLLSDGSSVQLVWRHAF